MIRRILCLRLLASASPQDRPPLALFHSGPEGRGIGSESGLIGHLTRLAEYCLQLTPHVSLDPWPPGDSLYLDLTDVSHLVADEREFVLRLLINCYRQGFHPMLAALADTAPAAWALTHFASSQSDLPLSRAWIIPPGQTGRWIGKLPVEALRAGRDCHAACHELGCHTLADVLRIPLAQWRDRLGRDFVIRLEKLLGHREEVLPAFQPPVRFAESLFLEYPTTCREILDPLIFHALSTLGQRLSTAGRGALELTIEWWCDNGEVIPVTIGFIHPTADAARFFALVQLRMEALSLPAPIIELRVLAPRTAPLPCSQSSLFSQREFAQRQEVHDLLERLAARLGQDRVCQASLEADHAPECVTRWRTCLTQVVKGQRSERYVPALPGPRPVYLFDPPENVKVMKGLPSGVPYRLHYRGQLLTIVRCWGPERIETGWWRGQDIHRDYYRVELITGQHFWIYRCLKSDRWFLHGIFG